MGYILNGGNHKYTSKGLRYKCPCCGNYTFENDGDPLSRCPVCFWQGPKDVEMEIDRIDRLDYLCLDEASYSYYLFGVCDLSFMPFARKPIDEEVPNILDKVHSLTDEMYDFIFEEFGIEKPSLADMKEEELDELYDKLCDIEIADCDENGNQKRCELASDIVTILGDAYHPIRKGYTIFDEDDIMEALKINDLVETVQNGFNNAGWDLQNGITLGTPDIEKAIIWYEKAAKYGCTTAMINLGNIYEEREDYENAYYWYNEAALADDTTGMLNVANMYFGGWHVNKDYEKAYVYYKKLADLNIPEAYYYLGLYEENGYIESVDYTKAKSFYLKAIDLGDAYSATNLGRLYILGYGLKQDYVKGLEYYQLAASRGDALAYANIGFAYETGQGVSKDLQKAKIYYSKGAEMQEEHCIEALERLKTD